MENSPVSQRCLSGGDPIPLGANTCNLGFFCPNNTADNPPEYCPPVPECLIIRLGQHANTCSEPQGIYEPIICSPGFYCPPNGEQRIICPRKHFCPLGTTEPIRCMKLSVCPEGSIREFRMVGLLGIILADSLLLTGYWLSGSFGKRVPRILRRHFRHLGNRQKAESTLDPISESENQKPPRDIQTGKSKSSLLGWDLIENMMKDLTPNELGIELGFQHLEFRPEGSKSAIIQGLSGRIPKGSFFGIMGPSGAGKTTLIKILAGHIRQTAGIMTLNEAEDVPLLKQLIGYVPQSDVALADLTVGENVLLSARIQLGGIKSDELIRHHVDCVLSCMGLAQVQDSVVGDPSWNRGISGGERKRVSIALRLVAMPLVLLLDEPTSGLDACTALSIMKLLESISRLGITVVCVIHQPRAEIFNILHYVLLIVQGMQMYMGQTTDVKRHFEAVGYKIPDRANLADAVMDILSSPEASILCHDGTTDGMNTVEAGCSHTGVGSLDTICARVDSQKARWYRQCFLHFVRGIRQQFRQTTTSTIEVLVGAISGLMMGLAAYDFNGNLFHGVFKQPFEPLSSAVDYTFVPQLALLSTLAISLAAAPAGVQNFGGEKDNFYREADAGHSRSAYFVGKELSTIPRVVLSALHFTTFYIILATPTVSFGMLFLLNTIYFYCVYGLSSIVTSVARRENALFIALLICLIVGICNGYGPRLSRVKFWNLEWFWYICPGTWFSEAYFTEHVERLSYLYDTESAAAFNGYVLGRTEFDIGILLLIGTIYRVAAYILLSLPTTKCWWFAGRFMLRGKALFGERGCG